MGCSGVKTLRPSIYDIENDGQSSKVANNESKQNDIDEITLKYNINDYKKGDKIKLF